jgi:hypothetical protein
MILAAMSVPASTARAQEPTPPQPAEPAPPVEAQPVAPPVAAPPPAPAQPAPPPAVRQQAQQPDESDLSGADDLDTEKRPVGIGYAGISQVPVGGTVGNLTAPALGARIWVNPKTGIDVALGFAWADGTSSGGAAFNAVWGFVLQGGVPIALATHRHVSFQVIPYAAYAHGSTKNNANAGLTPSTSLSGWRFDFGARAGLEIFWGFIGLPQLSLSSTVGVAFEARNESTDTGTFGSTSTTTYSFTTTVQNNPWDIFTGSVAARYYF